ncbi:hypothetical protein OC844_004091 [Tilletia horrida]|nr:hypothetical protein OC844_004091 [Tilletia horrida]
MSDRSAQAILRGELLLLGAVGGICDRQCFSIPCPTLSWTAQYGGHFEGGIELFQLRHEQTIRRYDLKHLDTKLWAALHVHAAAGFFQRFMYSCRGTKALIERMAAAGGAVEAPQDGAVRALLAGMDDDEVMWDFSPRIYSRMQAMLGYCMLGSLTR